jgi:hypothetical protein
MGKQLRDMLTDLRAEVGHSTNPAHGINDRETLLYMLNRTQMNLYRDYDWPQLIVDRDVKLADGQRYYAYPTDLAFDDIQKMWVLVNTVYNEVLYGIGPAEMAIWNSDQGLQSWPTQRWMHNADSNMFELWPVPDANGAATGSYVRLRGTKTVTKMINDSDEATLPDNIIVLFAAAEVLARDNAKDAPVKMKVATDALRRHRVRQFSHKGTRAIQIGAGGGDAQGSYREPVLGLDYVPPGYGSGPGTR